MHHHRTMGQAPRTEALSRDVATLPGPCIGCVGCQGVCEALFEVMVLPDVILRDRHI